jgi:dipeptidyl aminopeptidase/acylaminoacyl peptidase
MVQLLERHVMKKTLASAPREYADASPIDCIHAGAPPFLVVHGDSDTLAPTDESRHFCAALRSKARAPVVYAEIPHAQHAFEIFPSPRAAHFLRGATSFVAHVYSRYLEARPHLETACLTPAPVPVPESVPPAEPLTGRELA